MGQDDNLHAAIAHLILGCVAGQGLGRLQGAGYTHPGMHANYLIHGVVGFLHYQSGILNNDLAVMYKVSFQAARYLALPCLMADLYRSDNTLSVIHLVSGLIPFTMALAGNDNMHLGNMIIACNIISLLHYSLQRKREWGYYTAGAALFAYFVAPQMEKLFFPLGLALVDYCAFRLTSGSHEPSM